MPIGARTHCARVCSRFPALEGIVGRRNGAAKHRGGGNLARNYYATSSMPRTATETEVPEKEIAKIESQRARTHVDITKRIDIPRCAKDRGNSGARRWRPDESLEFQHISHSSVKIASRASGVFDGRASIWRGDRLQIPVCPQ